MTGPRFLIALALIGVAYVAVLRYLCGLIERAGARARQRIRQHEERALRQGERARRHIESLTDRICRGIRERAQREIAAMYENGGWETRILPGEPTRPGWGIFVRESADHPWRELTDEGGP